MNKVALVTGADRGLGLGLTQSLLSSGWTVLAGRYLEWPELDELSGLFPGRLHLIPMDVGSDESVMEASRMAQKLVSQVDLLVSNAAVNHSHQINSISQPLDTNAMLDEFNVNSLGSLRVVHWFLPLFAQSELKRLCFISSEAGSIADSTRTGWFGYCMSKAAVNMAVKNLQNDLGPKGYTFRLYHPGWLRTYMSGEKNMAAHLEPDEAAKIALAYFLDDSVSGSLTLHGWDGEDLPW